MTDETDTDPAGARRKVALEAQMAARSAVLGVAGQIGAEIRERPVWPGAAGTMGCAEPAEGLRIARTLEAAAARGQRLHQVRPPGRPDLAGNRRHP